MRRRDVPVLCSEWTGMEGEPGFTSRINDIADIRWRAREGVSLSLSRARTRALPSLSLSLCRPAEKRESRTYACVGTHAPFPTPLYPLAKD
jgi:hypothetical protein